MFGADTIADVLDTLDVATLQAALVEITKKAERNKAFRDDTLGTLRCVATDGWEPFCTYERRCEGCLTRKIKRKAKDEQGNEVTEVVTQYYHRFVVAFVIAPTPDVVLAIDPVHSKDQRSRQGEEKDGILAATPAQFRPAPRNACGSETEGNRSMSTTDKIVCPFSSRSKAPKLSRPHKTRQSRLMVVEHRL